MSPGLMAICWISLSSVPPILAADVWPSDQTGISIIQKQLNCISHQVLEDSLNRRPGGKLVPYLIFCASFQASIFSGNYTNAPRLLAQVGESFDSATQRMITDIVNFSNRGHRLDFESLRLKQPIEDGKTPMETLLTAFVGLAPSHHQ